MSGQHNNGSRSGQRPDSALRSLLCERSVLSRADGSAQWTQGSTSVIAAVYGPRQAQSRKEDPTQAVVEVTFRPLSGVAGSKEVTYESHIRQLLESCIVLALHPRTSISVVLQVEREDGSVLACALNAACAALLDAAVPLKHMVVAAGCAVTAAGVLLMDPDAAEEQAAQATVCCAFGHHRQPANGGGGGGSAPAAAAGQGDGGAGLETSLQDGVMTLLSVGQIETDTLFSAVDVCRGCCGHLAKFAVASLQRSLEFKL